MKKSILLSLAVLVLAVGLPASAQTKIASVDMKKLFNGYYKTKMAQTALTKETVDMQKELKQMAEGLDKARKDYKNLLDLANDPAISADERERRKQAASDKVKELGNSQAALEQFQRQAKAQLGEKEQRMVANLASEIQKAVAEKAKATGYNIVLNSAAGEAIIYAGPDGDLTSAVLEQLNAGAPVDVLKSPSPLPFGVSTNAP